MESLYQQVTLRLRDEGGRMTSQRRLILQALEELGGHPTAEEIYRHVSRQSPGINLSTVYRTLNWLEENGFIAPRWFEEERRRERFEPAVLTTSSRHPTPFHFRCRSCNRILEFADPRMKEIVKQFERHTGAQVKDVELTFYGLCQACARMEAHLATTDQQPKAIKR
ncbi:Fur family transcriptional regulator [Anaerolinea sp.]|uniref:Fur family transcriptional regulator n=1 Tax=Anaerolinea sp. TaxID=1872519 RepID=UPI002ACDDA8A|nr:Fur family transcriptional regulator [Anaerolinea sp.]